MSKITDVIQQISGLSTYEKDKVFEFLKNVLLSNECNHNKISKYGKYHSKNGVKQKYKCHNKECRKTFNDFSKSPIFSSKKGRDKWLLYAKW